MTPSKALYELCIIGVYGLEPISFFELGKTVQGSQGCYSGPTEYRAPGYLEGGGGWAAVFRHGTEIVYSFATMERQRFQYLGGGINDSLDLGGGLQRYVGAIQGFRTDSNLASQYREFSGSLQAGVSVDVLVGIGLGRGVFWSWTDLMLRGQIKFVGLSFSVDQLPLIDIDFSPILYYTPEHHTRKSYAENGSVRKYELVSDIIFDRNSPIQTLGGLAAPYADRVIAAVIAMNYAYAYEELR
jgi:hypothetical protein